MGRGVLRAIGAVVPACIAVLLFAAALWDTENGSSGLRAQEAKRQEIDLAKHRRTELQQQNLRLELRVKSLRGESLDLDLLDEQARALLNQFGRDELVVPLDQPRTAR
jgi:cell division protein FtsB